MNGVYNSETDPNIVPTKKFRPKYVSLSVSFDPSREKKSISCIYCCRFLYKETGKIDAIVDTEYDNGFCSKEIICKTCKTRYIINQKIHPSQIYG